MTKDDSLPIGNVADILAIDDLSTDVVEVPEWNCSVKVKALSKAKQVALRKASTVKGELDQRLFEAYLFIEGVVEPKFERQHLDPLLEKSAGAFDKVVLAILTVSGMTPEAQKEVEADFPE